MNNTDKNSRIPSTHHTNNTSSRGLTAGSRFPAFAGNDSERPDVKILEKKTLYQGFAKVESYKLKHRLFAGGWSEPFERELLVRYDAVAALPYDPKLDKVVLIEQFRVGALRDKNSPWLLELVAGVIDKKKSMEEMVHLEVKEEAGLDIMDLIHIHDFWSSPGASTEHISLYCAIVDSTKADGIHGLDEENEDIMVHVMDTKDAFAAVKSGRINNAITIIALQWLELRMCRGESMYSPA